MGGDEPDWIHLDRPESMMKRLLIFLLLGAVIACMVRAAMEAKSAQAAANRPPQPAGADTMKSSGG